MITLNFDSSFEKCAVLNLSMSILGEAGEERAFETNLGGRTECEENQAMVME